MEIKYLGTSAAEGWPAMFCKCDNCMRAIAAGGRNLRTRSQALIDNRILIDFPPDTCYHVIFGGLRLSEIAVCLITHNHSDHLYVKDIGMIRKGFAFPDIRECLTFYGTAASGRDIENEIADIGADIEDRIRFTEITPFRSFIAEGYSITPLEADHSPDTDPVIYMIEKNGRSILYANDTGFFPDTTWEYLRSSGVRFDFVSLDCTAGISTRCRTGHMDLDTNTETAERLKYQGNSDSRTVFCSNHFSHNGGAIYDEFSEIAEAKGFITAYDGMSVSV